MISSLEQKFSLWPHLQRLEGFEAGSKPKESPYSSAASVNPRPDVKNLSIQRLLHWAGNCCLSSCFLNWKRIGCSSPITSRRMVMSSLCWSRRGSWTTFQVEWAARKLSTIWPTVWGFISPLLIFKTFLSVYLSRSCPQEKSWRQEGFSRIRVSKSMVGPSFGLVVGGLTSGKTPQAKEQEDWQ